MSLPVELEKIVTVTLETQLNDTAFETVSNYVYQHTGIRLPANFDRRWVVKDKDAEYQGKLPTRVSKYVIKNGNGAKMAKSEVETIGNFVRRELGTGNYQVDVTRQLDWQSGMFCDSGSCFWRSRNMARELFQESGNVYAIRLWDKDDSGRFWRAFEEPHPQSVLHGKAAGLYGVGRAWIVAYEDEHAVLCNAYGHPAKLFADLLSNMTGWSKVLPANVRQDKELDPSELVFVNGAREGDSNGYWIGKTEPQTKRVGRTLVVPVTFKFQATHVCRCRACESWHKKGSISRLNNKRTRALTEDENNAERGNYLCENCVKNHSRECHFCKEVDLKSCMFNRRDAPGAENLHVHVCRECFAEHYMACEVCRNQYHKSVVKEGPGWEKSWSGPSVVIGSTMMLCPSCHRAGVQLKQEDDARRERFRKAEEERLEAMKLMEQKFAEWLKQSEVKELFPKGTRRETKWRVFLQYTGRPRPLSEILEEAKKEHDASEQSAAAASEEERQRRLDRDEFVEYYADTYRDGCMCEECAKFLEYKNEIEKERYAELRKQRGKTLFEFSFGSPMYYTTSSAYYPRVSTASARRFRIPTREEMEEGRRRVDEILSGGLRPPDLPVFADPPVPDPRERPMPNVQQDNDWPFPGAPNDNPGDGE